MPALALVAPAPQDPPDYLTALLANPEFVQRIVDAAVLAENEGLSEALEPYRTKTHRGVRAQQQMVFHLGTLLGTENEFIWDEVDCQGRFVSTDGFASSKFRLFCRRGESVKGGFKIAYRKGRTADMLNANQTQLNLFGDPGEVAAQPAVQDDIINVVIVCEVVDKLIDSKIYPDAELRVYVGIPIDHKQGVVICPQKVNIHACLVGEAAAFASVQANVAEPVQEEIEDLEEFEDSDDLQAASG